MTHTKVEIDTKLPLTELVDRAASSEIITLTANGQEKAVLLSMEAFEQLVSIQAYRQQKLMPLDELRSQSQQIFTQAGYTTQSQIIDLVQVVKQEIAAERFQDSSPPKTSP
ncbi:type II toxin-antitoxin system prevent-host-death family antitoxin [Phormidesmis sp. 146-12]